MAVTDQEFTMFAGARKVLRFPITDEDNGGNLDLTGQSLRFVIARLDGEGAPIVAAGSVLVEKTVGAGIEINPAGSAGPHVCDVTLLSADTTNTMGAQVYFQLELIQAPDENPLASGLITLLPNVENA